MSEEQTIYIGPEDDLTSVRERLEHIPSRRVTLVIPAQTQLRSHVAWKLLHARARELTKDVLIVSSDPQIRSVAQAVKFRVVPSLEASTASRPRPSARPSRFGTASRARSQGSSQVRTPPGNEAAESRGSSSGRVRQRDPGEQSRPPSQRMPSIPLTQEPARPQGEPEETLPRGLNSTFEDSPSPYYTDRSTTYEPPYETRRPDSRAGNIPSIRPLDNEQFDEPDLLHEDFQQANDIREAASRGSAASRSGLEEPDSSPGNRVSHTDSLHNYSMTGLPHAGDDPLSSLEDHLPPPRSEQRAGASLESFETNQHPVQDISDIPTEVIDGEVEDLGDQGALDMFTNTPRPQIQSWEQPAEQSERDSREGMDDENQVEPIRSFGAPRSPRITGNTGGTRRKTRETRQQDIDGEDVLPPPTPSKAARPTPVTPLTPPVTPRPSAPLTPSRAAASSAPSGQRRPPLSRPSRRDVNLQPTPSRAGLRNGQSQGRRPLWGQPAQRRNIGGYVIVIAIILLFLFIGALAYFIPSADVTLTLPARSYTHAVKLNASPKSNQPAPPGVVYGDVLTKDFTRSGTGTATGTAKIGTAPATGTAIFTNNGQAFVKIPSGITVSTGGANGQQFATTAEAVVLPPGSSTGNTIEIPIQAQQTGTAGNVAAGTISVLPATSLNQIAQANNVSANSLKLQVTNARATSGGGAGNATVVTQGDLNQATKTLQNALNGDITTWIQQQKPANNDIVGKPAITAALVNPPHEGQVVNSGSFPAQLKATVTLLIIRNASLQAATINQLNTFVKNDKAYAGYTINTNPHQPVTLRSPATGGQGTALTLSFTAVAQAIPAISQDQIRQLVGGKLLSDAYNNLKSLRNVESATIKTSPGFIFWVPSLSSHINVNLVAASSG